ncbi:histidine phosphatase family protein [Anatilimnocola floriformis]|uniref:histidine phosphatase family protein n=1 Tax=Anatilimnocola floriformis TaxID=2948575 RepID=UPI0020C2F290|nr:histidine phosphatase family protein [Anatilimnocola floriformis]
MLPSPAPNTCVLVLVRHGATAANLAVPHVLQGCGLDLSLCEIGVKQAEQVAEFLGELFVDRPSPALFSSQLKRAVETAEKIRSRLLLRRPSAAHGANGDDEVTQIAGLHEVDVGRWEGRDYDDVRFNDVEAHQQFIDDAATYGYPEGETITAVANRVQPIFESLAEQNLGKTIIVVAHNILLRSYFARLLGIPLRDYRGLAQDNCCVNVLVWQDGVMNVRTINSTWHIK